jgi:hypothetical protein
MAIDGRRPSLPSVQDH